MGSLGMKRADKHGTIRRASSGELAEPQLREMVAALAAERARAVHDYGPDIDRLMEIIARIGGDIDDRERLLEKCTEPRLRAVTCAWLAFRVRGEARCTELEQALRIDESYIPARRLLAATIRRLPKPSIEQLQSAIDHYRIVLGRDPRAGTWFGFGVALNDLANLDPRHAPALRRAASAAYAAVVEREPHNYEALNNWGPCTRPARRRGRG
jgi:xanthine/CO dehydrogenase XdhC/CoxF family maturation factor